MPDVTVTAVRSFLFKGQSITKGESVTMSPIDASIENRQGNVSLARVQTRSMKAEAPEPEKPKRTRRSRRNGTPVPFTEEEQQQQQPESEASQRYRRRDMTAEDPQ